MEIKQKAFSPNQFLFEESVLEVLKEAKKHIRSAPFDSIEPEQLMKQSNGELRLDLYYKYFLAAMTHPRTKEVACMRLEKILREELFDREHLPMNMISTVVGACCSSGGGSTTGSSHGSTSMSTGHNNLGSSQSNESLYVVNLIKTVLVKTPQVSEEIQLALGYILEGTRNKRFGSFYMSVLEEIYNLLLVKIREEPRKRLLKLQVEHMLNEVEYYSETVGDCGLDWTLPKFDSMGKRVMHVHDHHTSSNMKGATNQGKFGKCFFCGKEADNYYKDESVPICSFDCKHKTRELIEATNADDMFSDGSANRSAESPSRFGEKSDREGENMALQAVQRSHHFELFPWLLENLPSGDEIIYSFLGRQLPHNKLTLETIESILKIIINVFSSCVSERQSSHAASLSQPQQSQQHYVFKQIEKHALNIFLHILLNYKHLYEHELENYFKVFLFEIVRILELIPIRRFSSSQSSGKESKDLTSSGSVKSKGEISSRESMEASNLSLDNPMNSLNNLSSAHSQKQFSEYLHYQQQFTNPFLNGIIQILANEDLFFYIYTRFDCRFFEQNLLQKMMNILSQYAKEEIISKEFGVGISGSSAYGVFSILKMLTERLVGYENHKNLRTFSLSQFNRGVEQFLSNYPVDRKQVEMKAKLPLVIELFNKKPAKGIKLLKSLFNPSNPVNEIPKEAKGQEQQNRELQLKEQAIGQNAQLKDNIEEARRRAAKLQKEQVQLSRVSVSANEENCISQETSIEKIQEEEDMNPSRNMEQKEDSPEQKPQRNQSEIHQGEMQQEQHSTVEKQSKIDPKAERDSRKCEEESSLLTCRQIAIILRNNCEYDCKLKKIPLFQKEKVAEYLGSTQNSEAKRICFEFFRFDEGLYSVLPIDDILRLQFNYFGLPKEGQKIEVVIDELSKVMKPHSIFRENEDNTKIYQYIYTLLMVQGRHNPNVKESDYVKVDMYLSMVKHIEEVKDLAEKDYYRIAQNSLNHHLRWSERTIFEFKYLQGLDKQRGIFAHLRNHADQPKPQTELTGSVENKGGELARETICLKTLISFLWEYIYISIVSNQKKNSTLGIFEAIVLFGKYDLPGEQLGFIEIFKRSYDNSHHSIPTTVASSHYQQPHSGGAVSSVGSSNPPPISKSLQQKQQQQETLELLLRLGIEFNSYLYHWGYLIALSYSLEESNVYHEHIDKIFTNLQFIDKAKLKIFLQGLCTFSSSDYKLDKAYNRELFVLRHITEILEYNLPRLEQVWPEIWHTIELYFKSICLHPRKQIAMAAIDSYKQLSLKILKIKPSTSPPIIDHSLILETYLYIFVRLNASMKDLTINILLNVVSNDLQSGWEIIYEILILNDSDDRTIVMKVVERLVTEIGYRKLTNLHKLHQIVVKELRLNVGIHTLVESILSRLWEASEQIDERAVWIETLKSVKDIYKASLNNRLLGLFFGICNRCVSHSKKTESLTESENEGEKSNSDSQPSSKQDGSQEQIETMSIERQVYTEIVDWLIFMIDNKECHNQKASANTAESKEPYILVLKQALERFKMVNASFLTEFLTGVTGLLNIFTMFIQSDYKLVFLLFFKSFLKQRLLQDNKIIKESPEKYIQILEWTITHFQESIPNDLLAMKKLDEDFKQEKSHILTNGVENVVSEVALAQKETHRMELIEFSLSAQEFSLKAISNLIYLDCLQIYTSKQTMETFIEVLEQREAEKKRSQRSLQSVDSNNSNSFEAKALVSCFWKSVGKVESVLICNYTDARLTNDLIILRNFLWNNGFLLYNNYSSQKSQDQLSSLSKERGSPEKSDSNVLTDRIAPETAIPGLHKHQKRTLEIILKNLPIQKCFQLCINLIENLITNYRLKIELDDSIEGETRRAKLKKSHKASFNRARKISYDSSLILDDNLSQRSREEGNRKKSESRSRRSSEAERKSKNEEEHEVTDSRSRKRSTRSRKQSDSLSVPAADNRPRQMSTTSSNANRAQIKVIQYENKAAGSASGPRIRHMQLGQSKAEELRQSEVTMRRLYMNDICLWISSMEANVLLALDRVQEVVARSIEFRAGQVEQKIPRESSFQREDFSTNGDILSEEQLLKVFLLCLDINSELHCNLEIMRRSCALMQVLLPQIMKLDIEYGWRENTGETENYQMDRGMIEQDRNE